MSRSRMLLTTHGLDALIVVITLAGAVATVARPEALRPDSAVALGFEVAAVGSMTLALLLRRRAPFVAPAATWLTSAGLSFLDGHLIVGQPPLSIAGMVAAGLLGRLQQPRQARVGLAIVVVCAVTVVYNDPNHSLNSLFFIPTLFALGWLVGFALNEGSEQTAAAEQRAAQAERERASAARVAVAEERARIARELHDVVAHAVSVMVLQVGAVRHRMPRGDSEDRDALLNAERAGRAALAEMRRLLEAMRGEDDEVQLAPQPGLGQVADLVRDVRDAGLDVHLEVEGEPVRLPASLDLSAYRILQEGLTNALKHAHAQHAQVWVRYGSSELALEVRDDGRGPGASEGVGHGLVGVRERVKLYGGEMTAGATEGGGFALWARLPLDGR